ncbi:MAG: alanine--tRNA ligase [Clostridiales bacterium]|nr:alanine--tRNA ligase [Clostridiales bacterium]
MDFIGLNEIRERFLSFFESRGHLRLESFPLVPKNDVSLLLINSGMAPLKPYFTGREAPPRKRVTTCQKCVRTIDIANVGQTARHGTFFEMLGNFSFGDYFKEEIIPWAWEFMTATMGIPEERLYVSVYEEDDEALAIWRDKAGLPESKIRKLGREDNFWEVGAGPCGPCSEIYFDRGAENGCGRPDCAVGCDCDRFVEIWNLVFTQFDRQEDGSYPRLKNPNIDTGMGLERIAAIMQGASSIFDVDTIKAIRDAVCRECGATYNSDPKKDVSIRIITDHSRSVTFLTGDGVIPGNEGRGYVLRRLLRRAAMHGRLLGMNELFLSKIAETAIEQSKGAYPELEEKREYILKLISVEEERFYQTLDAGLALLNETAGRLKERGEALMSGADAFRLYDTFGFPPDLLKEILDERGLSVDEEGFEREMTRQKERSRASREASTYMGSKETVYDSLPPDMTSVFAGYAQKSASARVLALTEGDSVVGELSPASGEGSVILDVTPFYAESGGQKGDIGVIEWDGGKFEAADCVKAGGGGKFAHIGRVLQGTLKTGQEVTANIDIKNRLAASRNHTATHLLQAALRLVCGSHIEQAGSQVSAGRLRFDFTHFAPLSAEEAARAEALVNEKILEGLRVSVENLPIEEARKKGAMALFGEKYGDIVRVVEIAGFSTELCGGTHLDNTSQAGLFKIISETGVSAGTRRIEALTGAAALDYYREREARLREVCAALKAEPAAAPQKAKALADEAKALKAELAKIKSASAQNVIDDIIREAKNEGGVKIASGNAGEGLSANQLRELSDKIAAKIGGGCVVILAAVCDGKGTLLVSADKTAVERGLNAGALVREGARAAGGSGGGKPNMAQAGIKDAGRLGEAVDAAVNAAAKALG